MTPAARGEVTVYLLLFLAISLVAAISESNRKRTPLEILNLLSQVIGGLALFARACIGVGAPLHESNRQRVLRSDFVFHVADRRCNVLRRPAVQIAIFLSFLFSICLSPTLLRAQGISSPYQVWVADPLTRVQPTDVPGTSTSINLYGARGETLDTQVIVTAPSSGLTNVNISASTLTGPGGATIPSSGISLFREYYLTWTTRSPDRGPGYQNRPLPPGTYPDPLVPFNDPETGAAMCGNGAAIQACNASVTSGQNQPYWIEYSVPRGAGNSPAGTYTGTITMGSDQGIVTIPVSMTLWNFELPLRPTFEAYGFYLHNSLLADRGYQQAIFREKFFVAQNWNPSDTPSDIANYGLNTVGLLYAPEAPCGSTPSQFPPAPSTATLQAAITANGGPTAGVQYMTYDIDDNSGCTAADIAVMQQWAANVHATNGPGIVVGTIGPQDYAGELQTDGTADGLAAFDRWAMKLGNGWEPLGSAPGKRWTLPSCIETSSGFAPAVALDFPPINERMYAGFLAQIIGAVGLEEFALEGPAVSSPWTNPEADEACGTTMPGDGLLLYPRDNIGGTEPAASIRLKAYRDGIQDYEYVTIANSLGLGAQAAAIYSPLASAESVWINSAYRTPPNKQAYWDQSPADLEAARLQLGNMIGGTVALPGISPGAGSYGSPLTVTISDTTPGATIYYTIDGTIPTTSSTQYTAAFQLSSPATVQAIAVATGYTNSAIASTAFIVEPMVATPAISPAAGPYASPLTVTISDSTPGATIYYTTNGTIPTISSTQYTAGFQLTSSAAVQAIAVASGYASGDVANSAYTVQTGTPAVNFSSGFAGETTLALNGGASINGTRLRLTDGGSYEARSAFVTTPVNVQTFTNNFSFQLTNPNADGFTFTIQGVGPNLLGILGGGLGYEYVANSMAVKFDLSDNEGEGTDSTGLYTNGALPTVPAIDMSSSGVNLHSGDVMNVQMTYDRTTLSWTITDATTGASFTTSAAVDIPNLVRGNTAYVGFTAGTGSVTAIQDILSWAYTDTSTPPTANFSSGFAGETTLALNGGASINGFRLQLTDGRSYEARSAFVTTPVNVQTFTNNFSFQLTNPNADGFTFTIQGVDPNVLGILGGGLGYEYVANSMALKFDLSDNMGEGTDSTGLYTNGALPTVPATDMTSSGVNLHSGDVMNVQMTYDGTTLSWTITDSTTGASFTTSAAVDIPNLVRGNTAYVGFTAGTGSVTATQEILTWTYSNQ